jgi:hypothetical protein
VREGEDANRTRVAGHLDEIQGGVASSLKLYRNGAIGFIAWLGGRGSTPCVMRCFPKLAAARRVATPQALRRRVAEAGLAG